MNNVQRRGAQRELREHLRPVQYAVNRGRLRELLRNHNRIARIDAQVAEFISPQSPDHVAADHISVGADDEFAAAIGVLVGAAGKVQIRLYSRTIREKKGILVVDCTDDIDSFRYVRDVKAVSVFQSDVGK